MREYVWLDDTPLAVVKDVDSTPEILFVHVDHIDRPVAMTDGAKAQVWDATYLPFGGALQITGPEALDARFPGQWFQLESGLHYNWRRHYDPTTGRYLEPDPLGLVDGPSLYAYAQSSPQMYVDPTGEWAFLLPVVTGGGNLALQLHQSGGDWGCVDWLAVGEWVLYGIPGSAAGRAIAAGGRGRLLGGLGANPFRGKNAQQIDRMLRQRGFSPRGDPVSGKGDYVNPMSGRSYHIDARHRPPKGPHVSVHKTEGPRQSPVRPGREYFLE